MTPQDVISMVNPSNGNLAFKIFSFEDNRFFDQLIRLNYYSIITVTEGEGTLKANFSEYRLGSNTLISIAPYQPFMITSGNVFKGIVICFHPDFFCIHKHQKEVACDGILFNDIYTPPFITLGQKELGKLMDLIEQMRNEMMNIELAQYELLVSYLKIFLITASRIKVEQNPQAREDFSNTKQPFILQKLKEAIELHFRTKHSASDYSSLLNISPKTLSKIAKTHFNKTLTSLISERIIIEAKRELYLTSKTVKEIAFDLGFKDEYYFSRFFKTNADVSPQLFRQTVGFSRGNASQQSIRG